MKTKPSGVSVGNIHINKSADIAKHNFLSKLFYIVFMLVGVQLAYADKLSVDFIYGSGVESIYFDQADMGYRYTVKGKFTVTPSLTSTGYQLTVDTGINNSGSSLVTNEFNKNSPRMQLGGTETTAYDLDFWFSGVLYINGHALGLDQTFVIAHENHKSSNADWWVADTSGNASLYDSGGSLAMTVGDDVGNYYCLSQNNTNYQVIVTKGSCSTPPPQTYQFTFNQGRYIHNLSFIPLESPESGQIVSIQTPPAGGAAVINVSAIPLNSPYIASSYNSLMQPNKACGQMANEVYSAEVHIQGLVCGPAPQYLDFYIPGYFIIDGNYVLSRNSDTPRVFILAHGENRWWFGTLGSSFDRYSGGFMTNSNQFTVHVESAIGYAFKASTDNSFEVIEKGDI